MNDNPRNPDQWTPTSSLEDEASSNPDEAQAARNEAMRQAKSITPVSTEGLVDQSSVTRDLTWGAERLALSVGSSREQKRLNEILTIGSLLGGMRENATKPRSGVPK